MEFTRSMYGMYDGGVHQRSACAPMILFVQMCNGQLESFNGKFMLVRRNDKRKAGGSQTERGLDVLGFQKSQIDAIETRDEM